MGLLAVGPQSRVLGKAHRIHGTLISSHFPLLWGQGCPGNSGILWVGAPVRRMEGRLWGL